MKRTDLETAVKKILFRLTGQATYLKLVQSLFFILYKTGYLKNDAVYKYHYFVTNLLHAGDYVVDMGANLGYFSGIFSDRVKDEGRVICIEPVRPFFDILKWKLKSRGNCIFYNYALGPSNRKIRLSIPRKDNYLRTGLSHIAEDTIMSADTLVCEAEMVRGSELLRSLPRLDYIKCDIEGHEEFVLPEMGEVIGKFKPMIQVETWGTHKLVVMDFMKEAGYARYEVYKGKLCRDLPDELTFGDYLFIHQSKEHDVIGMLKKKRLA